MSKEEKVKEIFESVAWLTYEAEAELEFTAYYYYKALKELRDLIHPPTKEGLV